MTDPAASPTPEQIRQYMEDTGLTAQEFGQALGFSDAARQARGLVKGERHGKPYAMTGTALRAWDYLKALTRLVNAHAAYRIDMTPENEDELVSALEAASAALPKRLQPKDLPA